ncbi:hypothetical protein B0H13DRAFT_2029439 [Mycena leptocephala]|nr:hypothetical protein B0H13DRAFT_2029439 [Mycena leptocephala]
MGWWVMISLQAGGVNGWRLDVGQGWGRRRAASRVGYCAMGPGVCQFSPCASRAQEERGVVGTAMGRVSLHRGKLEGDAEERTYIWRETPIQQRASSVSMRMSGGGCTRGGAQG